MGFHILHGLKIELKFLHLIRTHISPIYMRIRRNQKVAILVIENDLLFKITLV